MSKGVKPLSVEEKLKEIADQLQERIGFWAKEYERCGYDQSLWCNAEAVNA